MDKLQAIRWSALALDRLRGFPFAPVYGGVGHVLMFHRVLPACGCPRLSANSYLELTPEFLVDIIHYFSSKGYRFLSMDDIPDRLTDRSGPPFVVFTFDDGFRDVMEVAWPILRRCGVPITIYVATDFPDGRAVLWWNALEQLLLQRSNLRFALGDRSYEFSLLTIEEKNRAFKSIHSLIKGNGGGDAVRLQEQFFHGLGVDPRAETRSVALNWEELRWLADQPGVVIGAHTCSHPVLSQLNRAEASAEILQGKILLENKLQRVVKHFAYPFGGRPEAGKRERLLAEQAGFITAVTTRSANLFPAHSRHLLELPRICVGMSMTIHTLDLIRHGVIPMVRNRGRRVVTL
ncbi:MAG: polysaccharide deacetylase family protein [Magnetococcales bacterium]|nr:polysaccharide deacetylase family protein [Magnetococcales bacterium]